MTMASSERLQAIKQELDDLLEARIGDLLGVVQATQEVTRQIIATEEEIRRQKMLQERLEAELVPLSEEHGGLEAETRELQSRVDGLKGKVGHLRSLHDELLSNLSNLKGELDE
jgi:chromosome segregation ATPase